MRVTQGILPPFPSMSEHDEHEYVNTSPVGHEVTLESLDKRLCKMEEDMSRKNYYTQLVSPSFLTALACFPIFSHFFLTVILNLLFSYHTVVSTNQYYMKMHAEHANEIDRLRQKLSEQGGDGPSTSVEKRLQALEAKTSEHSSHILQLLAVSVSAMFIAVMKSQNKN